MRYLFFELKLKHQELFCCMPNSSLRNYHAKFARQLTKFKQPIKLYLPACNFYCSVLHKLYKVEFYWLFKFRQLTCEFG